MNLKTKSIHRLVILVVLVITSSCLNRQFIEGRSEIGSISEIALNDSSIIFGQIQGLDWQFERFRKNQFEIWIENSDIKTTNDTTGYYTIKTIPGTYTIKCQSTNNNWERLIEEIKSIEISRNTKTEINFYIGYTIE